MENELAMVGVGPGAHGLRMRVPAVFVALALVFTAMFLVQQHRAEAAPRAAVAAAALPSVGAADAQINFAQFVCPILLSVRAAFASSPFFGIVVAAINPILVAFGCIPSSAV
jgi:hypothetical protein